MKKIFTIAVLSALIGFSACSKDDTPNAGQDTNFTSGDGLSAATAYEISSPEQLARLAELVSVGDTHYNNKYYKLTTDIDLSAYSKGWNSGKGWTPIGTSDNPFKGTFDGGGYKVLNLFINSPANLVGLFGYVYGGTIKSLGIKIAPEGITGKDRVGSVAGDVYMGTVADCYSIGVVSGNDYVGGVVGAVHGGYSNNVTDCYALGKVSGNSYIGGVAGCVAGSRYPEIISNITNSYSTSEVSGNDNVGGLVGRIETCNVINCHAKGTVTGRNNYIGGMVGYVSYSIATDCYATGEVSGSGYVGGLAGYVYDNSGVAKCYSTGTVSGKSKWVGGVAGAFSYSIATDCRAMGAISGEDNWVGGVAGEVKASGVAKCYATGKVKGNNGVGGVAGYVLDDSIVTDSYATGEVNGNDHIGGVAGNMGIGMITYCYATGAVSGKNYIGGVAGYVPNTSIITVCYATGAVSGNDYAGGVAGYVLLAGSVTDCAALNSSITRISGGGTYFGRIAGHKNTATINNNVAWDDMMVNGSTVGDSDLNGMGITKTQIATDGTIGGLFTAEDGWIVVSGKLPGFSSAVDLPAHLK